MVLREWEKEVFAKKNKRKERKTKIQCNHVIITYRYTSRESPNLCSFASRKENIMKAKAKNTLDGRE